MQVRAAGRVDLGQIAAQVVFEDAVVEVGIMGEQGSLAYIVEEGLEGFVVRLNDGVLTFFDDGVGRVAKHGGNGAVGVDVETEVGVVDHLSLSHLHGCNLYDVVFVDVESGGLGVEDHNLVLLCCPQKLLDVGAAFVAQIVGRQYGSVHAGANEVACGGTGLEDVHPLEQSGPCDETHVVCSDGQVGQQQFHVGGCERVGS